MVSALWLCCWAAVASWGFVYASGSLSGGMPGFLQTATAGVIYTPQPREKDYGEVDVGSVVSVYDGDTITVNIPVYPAIIGQKIPVRVRGIDCGEIRNPDKNARKNALEIRRIIEGKLREAKKITLRRVGRDKYFRLLADVIVDGVSLGDWEIKQGYARPYDGGKKSSIPAASTMAR